MVLAFQCLVISLYIVIVNYKYVVQNGRISHCMPNNIPLCPCTTFSFTPSLVERYISRIHFLAIVNTAEVKRNRLMSFPVDADQMLNSCSSWKYLLNFVRKNSILFSIIAIVAWNLILAMMCTGSLLLQPCQNLLKSSEVVSHCGFVIHFPDK